MSTAVYVGMGSNIGDRILYLKKAFQQLIQVEGISFRAISNVYETEPVGFTEQDPFLNLVVAIETEMGPFQLLDLVLQIERNLGRERNVRWGPRTIDLDILLYGKIQIEADRLVVPHPRLHERAFVLAPLVEVAPTMHHPTLGIGIETLWNGIDQKGVTVCSMELAKEFERIGNSNI